jgi:hypothetical protein
MRRTTLALVLACLVSAFAAHPAAAAVGDSATGSGTIAQENGASFSFSATGGSGPSGTGATGTMTYSADGFTDQAAVFCLRVDGNRAVVAGLITQSTFVPPRDGAVGDVLTFYVQDNGTPGAGLDTLATTFGSGTNAWLGGCAIWYGTGPTITSGEIVVSSAPVDHSPATLTLSPSAGTTTVGEQHCVTATVTDATGHPVSGVTVAFSVSGSITAAGSSAQQGARGTAVTDANGTATFCYTSDLPGATEVTAYADANGNGTQDAGEPVGVATAAFVLPPSTAGCSAGIVNGGWITSVNGDKATLGGNAKALDTATASGDEEYQDHGWVQPLDVHSIVVQALTCTPDRVHAVVYGTATVDGAGSYPFRIEVSDLGEPGNLDTYSILVGSGYYSGERTLEGGNVQIH